MAFATSKRRKQVNWYVVDDGKWTPAGAGREGKELAQEWAAGINRKKRAERAGFPEPTGCLWSLEVLRGRHLEDARHRGLASVPRRECHWKVLLDVFGSDRNLDDVTPSAIQEFISERSKRGIGPATINRDLSNLRHALKFARRMLSESGYEGDPFRDFALLDERRSRRKPVALTVAEAQRLIRAAWKLANRAPSYLKGCWRQNAQIIELWLLTASRYNEVLGLRWESVGRRVLTFPEHKRGMKRTFRLTGRLAAILKDIPRRGGWVFPGLRTDGHRDNLRRFWRRVTAKAKVPNLNPHDLRHTSLSRAFEAGASIATAQALAGHRSPATTERTYLHLFPRELEPVESGRTGIDRGRRRRHK